MDERTKRRHQKRKCHPIGVAFVWLAVRTDAYYGAMASMVVTDWLTRSMSGCG